MQIVSEVLGEIRAELARQGIRQTAIVDLLGVSASSVSAKLAGTQPMTMLEFFQIAALANVDPRKFLPGVLPKQAAS